MSGFQMFAQSVGASNQLTGRVLDEYDQPIIGAVVKVSGTSIGRSTDADGAFTMKRGRFRMSVMKNKVFL